MLKQIHENKPHPHIVIALKDAGKICNKMDLKREASAYYHQALKVFYEMGPHPVDANFAHTLCQMACFFGSGEIGVMLYETAIEIYKSNYGDKPHPDMVAALRYIGGSQEAASLFSNAISFYKQALKMCRDIHGEAPHPTIGAILDDLGDCYWQMKDEKNGREYYAQAMAIKEAIYEKLGKPYMSCVDEENGKGIVMPC